MNRRNFLGVDTICRVAHAVWLSSLLIVVMLAAPIATAQTQPVQTRPVPLDKDYVIGPEDVLDIQVWGSKDLNQTVFVRPDGRLSVPVMGEIAASGKTVQQLQDHLSAVYANMVKAPWSPSSSRRFGVVRSTSSAGSATRAHCNSHGT
jgi:protein involved in polysaccharide export with SLBB domain